MTEQIGLDAVFNTSAFSSGLSKYTSGLDSAIGKTTSAGGLLGSAIATAASVGIAAIAALATATVVAAATIVGSIISIDVNASKMAHDLELLNAKTNLSTTALQEWNVAGELVGVTADDIANYYMRLSRSAYAASNGTKASVDAYAQLGISVLDTKGKLKDTTQLFYEAIDALGKMKNPTEQDAVAMAIFGRSAMDLMPLIKAGTANMKDLTEEAKAVGAVLDEKTIKSLGVLDDHLHFIQAGIKGMSQSFAAQFVPMMNEVTGWAIDSLKLINKGMPLTAGLLFMQRLSTGISTGVKNFKAQAPKVISDMVSFLTKALPMVIGFGSDIISNLMDGLGTAYNLLFPAGAKILNVIMKSLQDNWPKIEQAGRDLLTGLGNGIQAGWALIAPKLPTIGDILGWIFNTAKNISGNFLTWVKGVPWDELGKDVAAAISSIPWSTIGIDLAGIGTNLWTAISLALFGGTVPTNAPSGSTIMTEKVVKGIDFDAIGKAVAGALASGITGALGKSGLGLGDVSNWPDLKSEWATIGTQYGDVVADGMGPAFWKEYWKEIWKWFTTPVFTITFGPDNIQLEKDQATSKAVGDKFANLIKDMVEQGDFGPILQVIGTEIFDPAKFALILPDITKFSTYIVDNIKSEIERLFTGSWDWWVALGKAIFGFIDVPPVGSGGSPNGSIPNSGVSMASMKLISPPSISPSSVSTIYQGHGASTVTNNIVVNNPAPESASSSVGSTLATIAYLGWA